MAKTEATLIGGAELKAKFKGMEIAVNRPEFIGACEKAAEVIKREAHANVVRSIGRNTGRLQRSFIVRRLEPTRNRTGGAAAAVWKRPMIVGSKGASYAHMIEYGTRYMRARPFFRPAVDHNKARAVRIMQRGVKKAILAEAKKRHQAILFRQF